METVCDASKAIEACLEGAMINSDLLLYWMTHTGDGSWSSFRRSVRELSGSDVDISGLCRSLRISLSDLGHVDFFIANTQRWSTIDPGIGGLAMRPDLAVLWGGRTPALLEAVEIIAERLDCCVDTTPASVGPSRIFVMGPSEAVSAVSNRVGIRYEPNLAAFLADSLDPIPLKVAQANEEPRPKNWKVRSFDFRSLKWIDGFAPRSACEFSPAYGNPKYCLRKSRKPSPLLRLGKRECVYASALLQGIHLIKYDPGDCVLSTPLDAALPETFARVACLCSGTPAEVADGLLIYREVPLEIAALLAVAAGQPHPSFATMGA